LDTENPVETSPNDKGDRDNSETVGYQIASKSTTTKGRKECEGESNRKKKRKREGP